MYALWILKGSMKLRGNGSKERGKRVTKIREKREEGVKRREERAIDIQENDDFQMRQLCGFPNGLATSWRCGGCGEKSARRNC